VGDFFHVRGDFGFEKKPAEVFLSDGSKVSVDMLTVGGMDVTAFAGLNGNSSDPLGLSMGGVGFGLALMTDESNSSRKWT
jgi:hypothetical protein